ncbi:3-deoxy-D-manno-octulosonic-acid kinase [Planctomycetes bacterium Pla163]|uniref:3-deoxy-D-manno-octulosonic-acid kinase n=1 Tax=Rohdeia mirabilis TaxID=2528008 RepID=A0A518D290_9BACT|nr:3-deoxy-D-manno-octulosonic-acid kinase [Planctomycetes bacterium Pla163]
MSSARRSGHTQVLVLGKSALADRAEELLAIVEARPRDGGEFRTLEGAGSAEFYLKGGPLRGSGARRHGWARLLLRRPPPRLREFARLNELRANRFAAPEPVLAVARVTRTRVLSQLLLTARVPHAAGYEALLSSPRSNDRAVALDALAVSLARFHAEGFQHRDLYARNLLWVRRPGGSIEPVYLDLWRGSRAGPHQRVRAARDGRRAAHDLGDLFTDLALGLVPSEQAHFVARYVEASEELVDGFDGGRLRALIQERYDEAAQFLNANPKRRRGRPAPPLDWKLPSE